MRRRFIPDLVVYIFIVLLMPAACVNYNEEDLYGIEECDTTAIT